MTGERVKERDETEKFWISEGTMITRATTAAEAEEKMKKSIVIVDDLYEVKPFDFSHLKSETFRERMVQRAIRKLERLERRR